MFTSNAIANTVSTIQNAYQRKQLCVEVPYCAANASFLRQLRQIGYIQHFLVCGDGSRRVMSHGGTRAAHTASLRLDNLYDRCDTGFRVARLYLKYVNQAPLFSSARCYWSSRGKRVVTFRDLAALCRGGSDSTFLVFTDQGLLTHASCVQRRIGGLLVCGFYV